MPIYAFVDAPVASPTILLDLNNKAPFGVVVGSSTSPPTRKVNTEGSTARDGSLVTQEAYNDRQILLKLRLELGTTSEQQSEAIQTLGRLLDGPQWLMWQHDAKIEPVFYRTKYGDIDIVDVFATDTPERTLSALIAADPFSYGTEVTGTATIANDPSAATNPMGFVFPEIQGDVATPLRLKVGSTEDAEQMCIGSVAHPTEPPSPIWANVLPDVGSGGGWTVSTYSNSVYIGGSAAFGEKSNPSDRSHYIGSGIPSGGIPLGEYRLFVRARVPIAWTLSSVGLGVPEITVGTSAPSTDAALMWHDLGVVSVPFGGALDSPWPATEASAFTSAIEITANADSTTSGEDVYIDALVLVPAGLLNSHSSRVALIAESTDSIYGIPMTFGKELWLDGYTSEVVSKNASLERDQRGLVSTGFVQAVPGFSNMLTCLSYTGAKTVTFDVTYSYYPRYLYDRPATS